ncbi:MAG: class I SAM-dependent methyltransferase [Bacteroidia bacterium]|nr:class I SAM-dependent methyltransferase [Bacteroidia bacterium]MCC7534258.1 class I SAM-dependent methyltransferase [Bacteroidia bacterium]
MKNLFTPSTWKEYELIDCGDLEKLERFGQYILRRPEPQALWKKQYSEQEWQKLTDIKFTQKGSHAGVWTKNKNIADKWKLSYPLQEKQLNFNLSLTSFKHIGIFPEQALNWEYIYAKTKLVANTPKVLNLFAYTGGASLAAKAAGADVTHVDSVKQVISWSKENMLASGLTDIRWVVEDALKFVKREVKRGNKYNGIILDPPAYGIGANGERWKLEDSINEILQDIALLLDKKHFLVLNVYSLGLSPLILENLIKTNFNQSENLELGEVFLQAKSSVKLPLGILARFCNL